MTSQVLPTKWPQYRPENCAESVALPQVRGVAAVNVHDGWLATKGNVENDICVLTLDGNLDYNSYCKCKVRGFLSDFTCFYSLVSSMANVKFSNFPPGAINGLGPNVPEELCVFKILGSHFIISFHQTQNRLTTLKPSSPQLCRRRARSLRPIQRQREYLIEKLEIYF